jgi:hypothetical protein
MALPQALAQGLHFTIDLEFLLSPAHLADFNHSQSTRSLDFVQVIVC